MNITLTATQHFYIIACLADRGATEVMKYIFEVANKYLPAQPDSQNIQVGVSNKMICDIYVTLGQQQERLTYAMNEELRFSLFEQVGGNADLLVALGQISDANANETETIIMIGKNFVSSFK